MLEKIFICFIEDLYETFISIKKFLKVFLIKFLYKTLPLTTIPFLVSICLWIAVFYSPSFFVGFLVFLIILFVYFIYYILIQAAIKTGFLKKTNEAEMDNISICAFAVIIIISFLIGFMSNLIGITGNFIKWAFFIIPIIISLISTLNFSEIEIKPSLKKRQTNQQQSSSEPF